MISPSFIFGPRVARKLGDKSGQQALYTKIRHQENMKFILDSLAAQLPEERFSAFTCQVSNTIPVWRKIKSQRLEGNAYCVKMSYPFDLEFGIWLSNSKSPSYGIFRGETLDAKEAICELANLVRLREELTNTI